MEVIKNELFGEIRVIYKDDEAWFAAVDVCKALDIVNHKDAVKRLDEDEKSGVALTDPHGRKQVTNVVNESGLYTLILTSKKPEAKAFKRWITHDVLPSLRQQAGLKAHEAFLMMDREHQKKCMDIIHRTSKPVKVNYIKANTIANKCVSDLSGYPKMVGKSKMTDDQLKLRERILEDTVNAMKLKDDLKLDFSVSVAIYGKYKSKEAEI